ncbi:Na-Ca exchanger/integrin-beta4 domain protein [Oopsacas minuta]|uniref:Na-Ca exchanger/integrin-beta4 domain protein n=1 Tax=Oopsacas minuta TaxID=111878 RepID=A0AAV7KIU1_9METZ|nr:Na-Ca exchanger/integrin-beta4 domain protein [Oopsacas minuta]
MCHKSRHFYPLNSTQLCLGGMNAYLYLKWCLCLYYPIETKINDLVDRIVYRLNQRRAALLNRYHELRDEKAARRSARIKKFEELVGIKADTERRLQINELQELQERILADIELKLAEVNAHQPETHIVFRNQSEHLEQLIAELGEVLEEEVPIIHNYQAMREVVAVVKRGTAHGELNDPRAVVIDYNTNRIFVTEGVPSLSGPQARISIFTDGGDYLDSFNHMDMHHPYGIAIHVDNVYVTDTRVHAVFLFKIETSYPLIAELGTRGSQIGQFNDPHNLAVSTNGDVYVTDYCNHRIQILNSSLQSIRNLTEQPIKYPRDIKLTADEVYVLCVDNPCILVLSHAGERLRSLVSMGRQRDVCDSHFFCIDSAKNIIISDYMFGKVKIFNKEGTLIHTIEIGRQDERLTYPLGLGQGLVLTKDLNLVLVYLHSDYCLRIFSCL